MITPPGNSKMQFSPLTSCDDARKSVSEILKRVDLLIRQGELNQAEHSVAKAREIDPKNIYAYAFEERIHILKQQAQENSIAAAVCKAAEEKRKYQDEQKRMKAEEAKNNVPQPPAPSVSATPKQQTLTSGKIVQPESPVPLAENPKSVVPSPQDHQQVTPAPATRTQSDSLTPADSHKKGEEDRNLKIQRMIKIAVDAVRKEIEQTQSEIRARERAEILRKEEIKIAEAAEAARQAEEERQKEIRKRTEERLLQTLKETLARRRRESPVEPTPEPPSNFETEPQPPIQSSVTSRDAEVPPSSEREETLSRYKLVLSSAWIDGAVTVEEDATLKQLRQSLSISDEEHERLEKEVQREAYVDAFKKAWNSGNITPENATVLAELRKRFQITDEEHLKIESTLLWEIQPVKNKPTLLVVDDDERLLAIVSQTLNEAGFITRSVTTSDEAYAYIRESPPDLILCDVNLETSTMGGFAFYEKVREMDQLRDTPFIFLSGLSDEALVRTGKELGVDDYLSKPVSGETLVATIRGKLRRYHQLKKSIN
jgi:CheY-like chemotaxis protein